MTEGTWANCTSHSILSPRWTGTLESEGAAAFRLPNAAPNDRNGFSRGVLSALSNDPCPCGSGKKYKKCHGAEA
jgi:hypothetical protein